MMGLPHDARVIEVDLPGGPLALYQPRHPKALVDAIEVLDADERLPYWADLWPAGLALAAAVDAGVVPVLGARVLELGCGLGVVGLAAARRGAADVVLSDWDPDARAYAAEAAALGGLTVTTRMVDWRSPPSDLRVDVILGADVLYERRHAQAIARTLEACLAPDGVAWLSDPTRAYATDLADALPGWRVEASRIEARGVPRDHPVIDLYRFSRSASR